MYKLYFLNTIYRRRYFNNTSVTLNNINSTVKARVVSYLKLKMIFRNKILNVYVAARKILIGIKWLWWLINRKYKFRHWNWKWTYCTLFFQKWHNSKNHLFNYFNIFADRVIFIYHIHDSNWKIIIFFEFVTYEANVRYKHRVHKIMIK